MFASKGVKKVNVKNLLISFLSRTMHSIKGNAHFAWPAAKEEVSPIPGVAKCFEGKLHRPFIRELLPSCLSYLIKILPDKHPFARVTRYLLSIQSFLFSFISQFWAVDFFQNSFTTIPVETQQQTPCQRTRSDYLLFCPFPATQFIQRFRQSVATHWGEMQALESQVFTF